MVESLENCAALVTEISAFYNGIGQPSLLNQALRSAVLIVPVTRDDRPCVTPGRENSWLCAFTSEMDYARFLLARGQSTASRRFRLIAGHNLIDKVLPGLDAETGIYVNTSSRLPMAFPPDALDSDARRAG